MNDVAAAIDCLLDPPADAGNRRHLELQAQRHADRPPKPTASAIAGDAKARQAFVDVAVAALQHCLPLSFSPLAQGIGGNVFTLQFNSPKQYAGTMLYESLLVSGRSQGAFALVHTAPAALRNRPGRRDSGRHGRQSFSLLKHRLFVDFLHGCLQVSDGGSGVHLRQDRIRYVSELLPVDKQNAPQPARAAVSNAEANYEG